MVTEVGAALLVNVAVLSGTVGVELQLVPVVHSAPGPVQVPSTAYAAPGASAASQMPPSSAARVGAEPAFGAAIRIARLPLGASGATAFDAPARAALDCNPSERIYPTPCTRHGRVNPAVRGLSCRPRGLMEVRRYGGNEPRSIRARALDGDWPPPVAFTPRRHGTRETGAKPARAANALLTRVTRIT